MVKAVKVFQTDDGKTFPTEKEAKDHEHGVAITGNIQALLAKLNADGSIMTIGSGVGENGEDEHAGECLLENFLIDNHAALRDALSGATVKKTRKPRKPRAAKTEAKGEGEISQPAAEPAKAVAKVTAEKAATKSEPAQKDDLEELMSSLEA